MTITICHNKLPDRKWSWSVDEVISRRDGSENFEKTVVEIRPLKAKLGFLPLRRAVEFFGSRPAEMNRVEILNITRCAAHWGGVRIVWLA